MKKCKNGCDTPTYLNRHICKECVLKENRERWHRNRKYYARKKKKVVKVCLQCGSEFETAKDNQKFCKRHIGKNDCKYQYHFSNRDLSIATRAKAITRIHDRGKKRINGESYTQSELNTIIRMYSTHNAVEIAAILDRPVDGVRNKIRQLKKSGDIEEVITDVF